MNSVQLQLSESKIKIQPVVKGRNEFLTAIKKDQ